METEAINNSGLTVAYALAAGIIATSIARHIGIPGIVVLLATGVFLGPDILGVIDPGSLGQGLVTILSFSVAVILFEGGLSLNISRLRRAQRPIQLLVTSGAIVTMLGGTLAAHLILGWDWRLSFLFGTLVIVTGPTVVTPLLRRLKVEHSVATILEAEGVFIDAIGAIIAAVALQVAVSPSGATFAKGLLDIATGLGVGSFMGLFGGLVVAYVLRFRYLIPEGLENVFTLSMALALFQSSNAIMHESGIAAVTVAGLVVGNTRTHVQRELMEFKEQLTVMLIGMLFVLLAADVRLAEVHALGLPGLMTAAVLMFIIRPLNVLAGTWGTDLTLKQKAFIAWIAPRGIVAAAIASLFATELEMQGIAGGPQLRAMVFLVISITVVSAGLTGGVVSRFLGLRRRTDAGWVILGANELARALARVLMDAKEEVVCLDSNPEACHAAQHEGIRVIYGNALEERTLLRSEIDTRAGALGVAPNEEVNLMFVQKAKREGKLKRLYVTLLNTAEGVTTKMVHDAGARMLFGRPRDVNLWSVRMRRKTAIIQYWTLANEPVDGKTGDTEEAPSLIGLNSDGLYVALIVNRAGSIQPIIEKNRFRKGDTVALVINVERQKDAESYLQKLGWQPVVFGEGDKPTKEMAPTGS
jgi:NhaP-type Na+/H+ or K+/H+ antiporter